MCGIGKVRGVCLWVFFFCIVVGFVFMLCVDEIVFVCECLYCVVINL